ncbi:hypothetical protein J4439_02065 [Candidatus Woesearchaeota archaeon]|nr:hypothetical protein [Candidatus Woesearchaeota archaeon]
MTAENAPLNGKQLLLLLGFAALMWLLPVSGRFFSAGGTPVDADSYFALRMAKQHLAIGPTGWDVVQQRPVPLNPYHLFLAAMLRAFGEPAGIWMATLTVSLLSVGAVMLMVQGISLRTEVRALAVVLWCASPAYLRLAASLEPAHLGVPVVLLALVLLYRSRSSAGQLAAAALIFLTMFLSPFNFLLGMAILAGAALLLSSPLLLLLLLLAIPVPVMWYQQIAGSYSLLQPLSAARPVTGELLTDLGATVGFGIFTLFLAAAGLLATWKRGLPYNPVHLPMLLVSLLFMFFIRRFTLYFTAPLCIIAAMGILALWLMRWELGAVRNISLLIITCGLLFTTLSYATRNVRSDPLPGDLSALETLAELPGGLVLSAPENGFLIEHTARPAYVDGMLMHQDEQRALTADAIFQGRNLLQTRELLAQEGIRYLYIDPGMRRGGVWQREGQGLLFLLQDADTFQNVFSENGHEIWVVNAAPATR